MYGTLKKNLYIGTTNADLTLLLLEVFSPAHPWSRADAISLSMFKNYAILR